MKITIYRKKYFSFPLLIIFLLVIVSLISCSDEGAEQSTSNDTSYSEYAKEKAAPAEIFEEATPDNGSLEYEYAEEAAPAESSPEHAEEVASTNGASQSESSKSNKLDEYTVVLGADEQILIPGLPGELRVWIGSSNFKPNFPARMAQDKTTVPAVGESAKVEPFAPAFEIEPAKTQCIRIHPSGSEVRFKLIPQKSGTFEVGANVYLFYSINCSGSPIPKTAATLKVTVEVDHKEIFVEKAKELWDILWKKILEFWAALVALILGLFLFLIKGKLKRWFGFENK